MLLSLAAAVISMALAPVYDGVERKVRAAIHTRIGPPVLQTWYDIVKLFSKEAVIPAGGTWSALVVVLELATLVATSALLVHVSAIGLPGPAHLEVASLVVLVSISSLSLIHI